MILLQKKIQFQPPSQVIFKTIENYTFRQLKLDS